MKEEQFTEKRIWTGKWIEPDQEPAYRVPELDFAQMVAAQESGIPGEEHLRCVKHLHRVVNLQNEDGEMPVSAVIYASAHGVYDLYVNGKKADDRLFAPETTNYQKLLWYQKYDLSERAADSDRLCLDVLLGDGWWTGHLGMAGTNCNYGDKLGFIMDLELVYPDGSVQVIGSDERFISCDSFIKYSDLFIGEMQDGTFFDFIDGLTGCPSRDKIMDDEYHVYSVPDWKNCKCANYPVDILRLQPGPCVKVIREIPFTGFVENQANDLIADFGQVLAGVVRIKVHAAGGTQFTVEHSEVLDQDGNYFNNIKGLYKDQKDRYICRGEEQTFTPHFTYHGFRYIRITGLKKEEIADLTALVISTPLEKTGTFETDDPLINGLQTAIENSTVSNMISVPTDCPQREKLGWTGDINIFTKTGAFLYDLRTFLRTWLMQVRLDQGRDGEIPVVVPNHPCQDKLQRGMSGGTNSSAAWSDCIIFMPLELYRIYGDISFLTENFAAMEKWFGYVKKQTRDSLWIHRFHFGDWLIPSLREEADGVMKGVMATSDITGACYYSLAAKAMAQICRILEDASPDEQKESFRKKAASYERLRKKINDAIVKTYVYPDGRVGVHAADAKAYAAAAEEHAADPEISSAGPEISAAEPQAHAAAFEEAEDLQLQGLYVMLLKTEAVSDEDLKNRILNRLVKMIEAGGYTLDCGFSSIHFLLDVLYDNGFRETAWKLLFSTDAPSWLYMIKNGATTIWENWRAVKEDGTVTDSSFNHYAYGCVGDFMYRHMGGIQPCAPGYAKVRIAPDFHCGLKHCRCSKILPDCAGGKRRIVCDWSLDDLGKRSGTIRVEVPDGVTGMIVLPDGEHEITDRVTELKF